VLIEVPDALAAHLGVALLRYIRQARRDGGHVDTGLVELAGYLCDERRRHDVMARREQWRRASAQYRARRRQARAS